MRRSLPCGAPGSSKQAICGRCSGRADACRPGALEGGEGAARQEQLQAREAMSVGRRQPQRFRCNPQEEFGP